MDVAADGFSPVWNKMIRKRQVNPHSEALESCLSGINKEGCEVKFIDEYIDLNKMIRKQREKHHAKALESCLSGIYKEGCEVKFIDEYIKLMAAAEMQPNPQTSKNSTDVPTEQYEESEDDCEPAVKKKKSTRKMWSKEEEEELELLFSQNILQRQCPRIADCTRAIQKSRIANGLIHNRNWETIKKKVANMIRKIE